MGLTFSYSAIVPDVGDFDNLTGNCPGYLVEVGEHDGLVALTVRPANQSNDPRAEGVYGVVFNPEEADDLVRGLREAVDTAREIVAKGNGLVPPKRVQGGYL